jgi:hypothetical protein
MKVKGKTQKAKGRRTSSVKRSDFTVVLLLASVFWLLTPALHADRLRATGLETNNFTQTEWSATSGAGLSIQTGTVHSGTYAIRINQTSSTSYGRLDFANQTSGTIFVRAFFRFTTRPNVNVGLMQLSSGGSGNSINYVNSGATWQIQSVGGAISTGTTALSTGQWYRFELSVLVSDTVGTVEGRLYSDMDTTPLETLGPLTGQDTLPSTLTQIYIGAWSASNTSDFYIDDIIINNSSGAAPFNTWAGGTKLALLKPASNDTVTWTKTGANCSGTTNADCVDDEPGTPDDASGYTASSTANNEDRLNVASLPAEIPSDADMISLTVYDRWDGNGTTGTRQGRHLIWDESGAQTNGPTHSRCDVAAGTWSVASSAQITAFGLGARTKANVGAFDLGYEPLNSAECRVTAIWGNVEWKPAPAVTVRRRRPVVW